jgi:hypothetical protein
VGKKSQLKIILKRKEIVKVKSTIFPGGYNGQKPELESTY